jgi:lysozyme family protein
MKENFDFFFEKAVEHEGKVCEDVAGDGGGPTKWGITIGRLATIRRMKEPKRGTKAFEALKADLYALSESQIKEIYRRDYWDAVRGDDLPHGLDYAVADFGLNSGPSRANTYLQRQMGNTQTGKMDDTTIEEVHTHNLNDCIVEYCLARERFLRAIVDNRPGQSKFLKGWLTRVTDVRAAALQMASHADPAPEITVLPKAIEKEDTTPGFTMTAVKSKSVWLQIKALALLVVSVCTDWISNAVDFVSSLVGIVPDVKGDVQSVASTGNEVAGFLKISTAKIVVPLVIITVAIAIVRHVNDKRGA